MQAVKAKDVATDRRILVRFRPEFQFGVMGMGVWQLYVYTVFPVLLLALILWFCISQWYYMAFSLHVQ